MTCKICGRPSAAGAKLCPDCRAARKRAYDATITQPLLALTGAGTVSRTLSRLRRDTSPEAKARRAARKAQAAAPDRAVPAAIPVERRNSKRPLLLTLLAIGVALAAIAGWYMPSRAPDQSESFAAPPAVPPAPTQDASDPGAGSGGSLPSAGTAPPAADLAPLPTIVERELVPHSPAPAKPPASRRVSAPPKTAPSPPPDTPPEIEVVRAPPAPVAAPPQPARRIDPWQQMAEAIGRCPSGFLDHVLCEQRVRLQYCDGHWGQVAQCPGGPSVDHN
jgi:hypothetical protein